MKMLQMIIDLPPDQYRIVEPGPPPLLGMLGLLLTVLLAVADLGRQIILGYSWAISTLSKQSVLGWLWAFEVAGTWLAGKTLDYTLKGIVTC